jgi:hypothetical protein
LAFKVSTAGLGEGEDVGAGVGVGVPTFARITTVATNKETPATAYGASLLVDRRSRRVISGR